MHARNLRRPSAFPPGKVVAALTVFSVAVFVLLSHWSAPVWHTLPNLVFLQFPWRFLAVESAAAVALCTLLLDRWLPTGRVRYLLPAGLLTALLAGYFGGGEYFREACADDETVQVQRRQFVDREGVGFTDEYTPRNADNDVLSINLPPAWIGVAAQDQPDKTTPLPQDQTAVPEHMRFITAPSTHPSLMVVRLRRFTGWHILRDGVEIAPGTRSDGLVVVPLPAGPAHRVEAVYRTTADQWAGLGISALMLLGVAWWRRRPSGIMGPSA